MKCICGLLLHMAYIRSSLKNPVVYDLLMTEHVPQQEFTENGVVVFNAVRRHLYRINHRIKPVVSQLHSHEH